MSATRAVSAALALLLAVSFATPSGARADSAAGFEYTVTDSLATVTGCTGGTCPTTLVIPARLGGYRVRSIGNSAFYDNRLTRVTIPNSVTSIGDFAFQNNRLTRLTIGNSVTSIGDAAFQNNRLTRVTIPDSVTSIGGSAFEANRLTRVIFLGNAPTAGPFVFNRNDRLTQLVRQPGATGWAETWGDKTVVIAP